MPTEEIKTKKNGYALRLGSFFSGPTFFAAADYFHSYLGCNGWLDLSDIPQGEITWPHVSLTPSLRVWYLCIHHDIFSRIHADCSISGQYLPGCGMRSGTFLNVNEILINVFNHWFHSTEYKELTFLKYTLIYPYLLSM